MSNYEGTVKTGHPVLGVVLAVLGIGTAVLLTFVFGAAAGAAAALLGLGAVLLGVSARKSGRGMGAIVTGAIAMVMAVVMTFTSVGILKAMHDEAAKSGVAPVVPENFTDPYLGIAGVVLKVGGDEEKTGALLKEMEALKDYMEKDARTETANAETAEKAL